MLALIARVSKSNTNVLIIGESGTGKELVARMIHESGPLAGHPFVPINCGAIPENLIESEMFGHKKGSFTGAVSDKQGMFEVANGGTIFLDEVGELPMAMQVKLLRVIQERSFRRVGGTNDIKVSVRIIAATNRDLEAAIHKNTFREDLYYRLNVIQIRTPPLRERKEDIPVLIDHFLKKFSTKLNKNVAGFEPEAERALLTYQWPGNIRELENVIERAMALENGTKITRDSLPTAVLEGVAAREAAGHGPESTPRKVDVSGLSVQTNDGLTLPPADFSKGPLNLDEIINQVEKHYLMRALESAQGVKKKAAELLGITFRSIRYRLKKLGVSDDGEPDVE